MNGARLALLVAAIAAGAPAVGSDVFPGSQWAFKTPAETGMDATMLQQASAIIGGRGCVVRNGTMVHTWGNQSHRSDIASAAKPVYTHFLLEAVEDGLIPSLDDLVMDFEPALMDLNAKLGFKDRDITWRHMANQISCYGVVEAPGTTFDYSDYQMALFWDTLFLQVYGSTWPTVDDDVFHPMLTDLLQCQDDPTMMSFGIVDRQGRIGMSVRDLCRFGLLYVHGGNWDGVQLISQANAAMAVTSPLPNSIPRTSGVAAEMIPGQRSIGRMNNQYDHLGSYSFLWWVNGIDGAGQMLLPDVPTDAYVAWGDEGRSSLAVIPSLGIILSWNNGPIGWDTINLALGAVADAVLIDDTTPPGPPSGLVATAVGDTVIDLGWQAAADPESGVNAYNVYRDDVIVSTVTAPAYVDVDLIPQTLHSYRVTAINGVSLEGPSSAAFLVTTGDDTTPPTIDGARADLDPSRIAIVFNEPLDPASASDASNYAVDNGVSVTSASLGADEVTVTLQTSPLAPGVHYRVSTAGVLDASVAGNPIAPNTVVPAWVTRVADGVVVLYDLEEGAGAAVQDVSIGAEPIDLTVDDPQAITWIGGGLSIDAATIASATGPSTEIRDACVASNEITIEAWITPDDTLQTGPARIVTFSADIGNRNFTLGQAGDAYNARLRTTATSNNGQPSLTSPAGDAVAALTHVAYTRDAAGTARLYVSGVERASGAIGGDLSNWNPGYTFALANEITLDRPWLGDIHLVAVYDRALESGEVTQNFVLGADPQAPPSPCAADLDGGGAVDILDLLDLLTSWGPCAPCLQDLNGSGAVDVVDLLALLAAWGPC